MKLLLKSNIMKKYIIYIFFILCSFLVRGYGQDISILPSPVAPNVESILKFNEFPVSYHTGIPDINIPIYTIKLNDISYPISIKYNASGIRVNEESGTIGLGWELNSYGLISRTIIEANDFSNSDPSLGYRTYFNSNIPDFLIPDNYIKYPVFHLFDYYATAPYMRTYTDLLYYANKLPDTPSTLAELAPDIYTYNFNGFSGKYALTHTGEIYKQSINQIKINYNDGEVGRKDPDKWTIITPDGTTYTFAQKQLTEMPTISSKPNNASSWYLTEIKTINGNLITFNYSIENELKYSISGLELHNRTSWMGEQPESSPFIPVLNQTIVLKNISFPNGVVEFSYNYDRQDLPSDPRLTSIIVKNVKNEMVKKVELTHDYFTANATNESEMLSLSHIRSTLNVPSTNTPSYYCNLTENWNLKRLKLSNINFYGASLKETYSFVYNEKSLPTKLSTARDHWGYHNGKKNNGLVPKQIIWNPLLGIETFESTNGNANRDVDPTYNQSFILNSITLPTGGKIEYEFEPNSQKLFDNDGDPNIENYLSTKLGFEFIGSRSENIGALFTNDFRYTFTIPSGYSLQSFPLKIDLELLQKRTSADMGKQLGIYIRKKSDQSVVYQLLESMRLNSFVNGDDINATQFSIKVIPNIKLGTGEYEIQIIGYSGLDKSYMFSSIKMDANIYKKATPPATRVNMLTGGLRVKKVSTFDNTRTLSKKIYEYSLPKLITNYPRYRRFTSNKIDPGSKLPLYNFFETSDGIRNKSYPVGYGSVTVYEIDDLLENNGKSVYNYITKSDKQLDYSSRSLSKYEYENNWGNQTVGREFDRTPEGLASNSFITYAENGLLNSESFYRYNVSNKDYTLLRSVNYEYDISNYGILWGIKRAKTQNQDDVLDNINLDVIKSLYFPGIRFTSALPTAFIYPVINQQKINIKNKIIKVYDDQSKQYIIENTSYTYNVTNNQIKEEQTSSSNGNNITTRYIYSVDKQEDIYMKLTQQNRVNDIIDIIKDNNGKMQQSQNEYSSFLNIPRISGIKTNTDINQVLEKRLIYHNYDSYGNPVYLSKDSSNETFYLWSYSGQYLIAEIKNASYSYTELETIVRNVFSVNSLNALSTLLIPNETKLKDGSLQTALPNALVTTYTYKPLVGMLSATNPSGITTYYDYDSFGRLKETYIYKDNVVSTANKQTIQKYDYHYQNQ